MKPGTLAALLALTAPCGHISVMLPYTPQRAPEPERFGQERKAAAEAKRARKLARYIDTPAARAQRAASELAATQPPWTPLSTPAPVDVNDDHPAGGV